MSPCLRFAIGDHVCWATKSGARHGKVVGIVLPEDQPEAVMRSVIAQTGAKVSTSRALPARVAQVRYIVLCIGARAGRRGALYFPRSHHLRKSDQRLPNDGKAPGRAVLRCNRCAKLRDCPGTQPEFVACEDFTPAIRRMSTAELAAKAAMAAGGPASGHMGVVAMVVVTVDRRGELFTSVAPGTAEDTKATLLTGLSRARELVKEM